jgi:hypothetical protein
MIGIGLILYFVSLAAGIVRDIRLDAEVLQHEMTA